MCRTPIVRRGGELASVRAEAGCGCYTSSTTQALQLGLSSYALVESFRDPLKVCTRDCRSWACFSGVRKRPGAVVRSHRIHAPPEECPCHVCQRRRLGGAARHLKRSDSLCECPQQRWSLALRVSARDVPAISALERAKLSMQGSTQDIGLSSAK
jgi:hypothetical protein